MPGGGGRAALAPAKLAAAMLGAGILGGASVASQPFARRAPSLSFRIDSGAQINAFLRQGDIAAHLVLRAGKDPRILVAFPAGDSGVAVWFAHTASAVTWTLVGQPRPIVLHDARGRALRGIEGEIVVDAARLNFGQVLLSSIRVLRDFGTGASVPSSVLAMPRVSGRQITWSRNRLDGAAGYRLTLEVLGDGTVSPQSLTAGRSGRLRLRILAATGERPLTPLLPGHLLESAAAPDARERHVLEFLSYREKFLAGSWRFDTYFGRDTLLTLMVLEPVLRPEALEDGLESVLVRLGPHGKVAHEEAIGEYAILENLAAGRGESASPVYDYGMIDESFLLAPLAARWLLEDPRGRPRARAFLTSRSARGEREGAALARNALWVVSRAADFAARSTASNLIGLAPGRAAGNWRDSPNGLAGGRYPYDVNVVFVPAALAAIERLVKSGLLDGFVTPAERSKLLEAGGEQRVWAQRAPAWFQIQFDPASAKADITAYARAAHVDPAAALGSIDDRPVAFDALALDGGGKAIAVMHSDVGFAMLLESPAPQALERMLSIMRPFPAGDMTAVGMLIANPAYAGAAVQARFTSTAYHGTVIWSWQQAVLIAGLDRQRARRDLPAPLRARLAAARGELERAIERTRSWQTSELWSWSFVAGRYRIVPFAPPGGEEADAAQLWSTMFLALPGAAGTAAARTSNQ